MTGLDYYRQTAEKREQTSVQDFNTYDLADFLKRLCKNPSTQEQFVKDTYNLKAGYESPCDVVPVTDKLSIVYCPYNKEFVETVKKLQGAFFKDEQEYFASGWIISSANTDFVKEYIRKKMLLKLDSDVEKEEQNSQMNNSNNTASAPANTPANAEITDVPLVNASSISAANQVFYEHKLQVVDFFHDKNTNILYIRVPFTNLTFLTAALGCNGIYIAKIGAWAFNYAYREEVGKAYKTALKEYGV